ncbi:phage tail tube protein [Streptomyces sp. NPDC058757]|uniref:phage tail tube protein n=1 Tax=Streptomyces sp. NPDC058757 TaxID=3346626 RepID=UPI0036757C8C
MSTPTETALARRWKMDVNMGDDVTPDWQPMIAITEFQPTWPPNIEDSTTYDTDGWKEQTKTGQEWQVELTFNRKKSPDSTTFSPVHEKLRLAAFAYGSGSEVGVRFYDRSGLPEAYTGKVLVEWEDQGGEYTALGQVQATLHGTGPLTPITNPVTP